MIISVIRWHLVGTLLFVTLCLARPLMAWNATGWESTRIHQRFYTEGSSAGDIDGDGVIDIVGGPLWYRGPDYQTAHEIESPKEVSIQSYSEHFFSHVVDVTGDGANDVIVIGFPGKSARLYVNPGHDALDRHWDVHEITGAVDNESPAIVDLVPGGAPEIVCGRDSHYGYYSANQDATKPWSWTPISRQGACAGRFAHGLGVGDVNNDGELDILDRAFWWENPGGQSSSPWPQKRWSTQPQGGGAQICVDDVDGDGDSDIVTSLNAHGWGLSWFEQQEDGQFSEHVIMGATSLDNPFGVAFSQMHAVALADIDQDGRNDIVTGKRFYAHGGHDAGGLQEPVLYWFRNTTADEQIEFVPHLIDRDSGVGTEVLVADLNQDGLHDIVTSSKRGLIVHTQDTQAAGRPPERWRVQAGRDQDSYAEGGTPAEAAENMLLPDGFAVDVIAAEPDLTQPIAMCFDARGRIWVIEGHTYPLKAPAGQGKDRVLILEDRNADGEFETQKVFIEGINLASGIEVGFGGVWIGAAPELLFIPDADRDDTPDSEPVVVLDGWGHHDTHETLNSFTWGPDGWLYGCHGVFTHSRVGKPGTPDNQRVPLNAGVWRYHPTQDKFEVFAHGTSNPWGVDFNDQGEWFLTACVIPHLFHIQQGARYQRQAGQHFNRHTYDDIKTIADHAHYVGSIREHAFWGDNKITRPAAKNNTSLVGGGHAHCGLAIYNGDAFPSQYYGELLFHNLHGHRLVRETVERNGSGFVGKHRPDFALARDHFQIGVGVMVGPDGAIYTSDWHDPQTCHHRDPEIWDRSNGRIYRIRYGEPRGMDLNLWSESDQQLVERLQGDNGFIARQAQRILQERAAESTLDSGRVTRLLMGMLESNVNQRTRLRALWGLGCIGSINQPMLTNLLHDDDPYVRGWAVHWLSESAEALDATTTQALVETAKSDSSRVVRRYIASLAQRLPDDGRWSVVAALASHRHDEADPNLSLLTWYALEPLVEGDPKRAFEIARASGWKNLFRFVVRRLAASESGRELLTTKLASPQQKASRLTILEEFLSAAESRKGLAMPTNWPAAV